MMEEAGDNPYHIITHPNAMAVYGDSDISGHNSDTNVVPIMEQSNSAVTRPLAGRLPVQSSDITSSSSEFEISLHSDPETRLHGPGSAVNSRSGSPTSQTTTTNHDSDQPDTTNHQPPPNHHPDTNTGDTTSMSGSERESNSLSFGISYSGVATLAVSGIVGLLLAFFGYTIIKLNGIVYNQDEKLREMSSKLEMKSYQSTDVFRTPSCSVTSDSGWKFLSYFEIILVSILASVLPSLYNQGKRVYDDFKERQSTLLDKIEENQGEIRELRELLALKEERQMHHEDSGIELDVSQAPNDKEEGAKIQKLEEQLRKLKIEAAQHQVVQQQNTDKVKKLEKMEKSTTELLRKTTNLEDLMLSITQFHMNDLQSQVTAIAKKTSKNNLTLDQLEQLSAAHLSQLLAILWTHLHLPSQMTDSCRTTIKKVWSVVGQLVTTRIPQTWGKFVEHGGPSLALDTVSLGHSHGPDTNMGQACIMAVQLLKEVFIKIPTTQQLVTDNHLDCLIKLCSKTEKSSGCWNTLGIIMTFTYKRPWRFQVISYRNMYGKLVESMASWCVDIPEIQMVHLKTYQLWLEEQGEPLIQYCGAWAIHNLISRPLANMDSIINNLELNKIQHLVFENCFEKETESLMRQVCSNAIQHECPETTFDFVTKKGKEELTDSGFVSSMNGPI